MLRRRTNRRAVRLALVVALVLLSAVSARAQTIVDGQRAQFSPSADHNTIDAGGSPRIQNYSMAVFVAGTTTPYATANLGKPAPDPDGFIRVTFTTLLSTPLQVGVVYESRVYANGSGGSTPSDLSNTFALTTSCASTISPGSQNVAAGGGTGSVAVTAGCGWAAISNASWITITAGAQGTNGGTVTFSVAPNTAQAVRTGTLTIAGNTFTVTQAAATCSYTIGPTSQSIGSPGGTGTVTVTTTSGCAWTASSNAAWLTVTGGASGNGPGSVTFSAAANTATAARTGTLTIAGTTFTVTQAAAASCAYSLTPTSQSVVAAGGPGTVTVTTTSGCAWTATSNAAWLTITSGTTGSGSGSATFSAAANALTSPRTGTLTIAGNTFTVTQAAAAATCSYTISPTGQSVISGGGSGVVDVTAPAGCGWTAASNAAWLAITGGATGAGNGSVTFSAVANTSMFLRTGTLTVAGKTFTVTQAGSFCSYSLTPTSQSFPAIGGTGSASVTTSDGCAWGAGSTVFWANVTSAATSSSSGIVTFSVSANTSTSPRTGTILIAGRGFTVTQAPVVPCTYAVSPGSVSLVYSGSSTSVIVTTLPGCSWTASSPASWLSVAGSGTDSGIAIVTAAPNSGNTPRSATITVAGQPVSVTQPALVKPPAPTGLRIVRQ